MMADGRLAAAPWPFPVRGVLEGFYGAFYTVPQRNDLIRFLGRNGFNFYLYGPKNDRQHRMRWWEPYPDRVMANFAETIWVARDSGVTFCYAISFGVPMDYSSAEQFGIVTGKLEGFYQRGCRAFCLLLDDLTYGFGNVSNAERFATLGEAHAAIANELYGWLGGHAEPCSLLLCPTDYHGTPPFSAYVHGLGRALHPDVGLLYTGPAICSTTIAADDARAFGSAACRSPVIWDNYPANDLQMRSEMHIGPLRGRAADLWEVSTGFLSNLMNQPEASKIPLLTIRAYLAWPELYDPDAAWEDALRQIGGDDSYAALVRFAENSLRSCLQPDAVPPMESLTGVALAALRAGGTTQDPSVEALMRYFDTLDEAGYHLKNRMRNEALRGDLLPWIEALEEKLWLGRGAIRCLRALETGGDVGSQLRFVNEVLPSVRINTRWIGGSAVIELAEYARERTGMGQSITDEPTGPSGAHSRAGGE